MLSESQGRGNYVRDYKSLRMEYAQNLFSWISEPPSAATVQLEDSSSHPAPDFLSVVRRPTTPTGSKTLTPLELRLKDLVLNLYSDQDSSTALSRISESELSELDSGNFSDQPSTGPSDSQVQAMTEQHLTTPLSSYDTTPVHQSSTVLSNFFSADDNAQVSQDPQLPTLSGASKSPFQFGARGLLPFMDSTSLRQSGPGGDQSSLQLSSSYGARPPYAAPPPDPSSFSLPLYSHTELNFSSSPATEKTSSSNLRSLVSRSFQIVPPQQQIQQQEVTSSLKDTPKSELTTPTTMPSLATPPASLASLPHIQQTLPSMSSADASKEDETISSDDSVQEVPGTFVITDGTKLQVPSRDHEVQDSDSALSVSPQPEDGSLQQATSSQETPEDVPHTPRQEDEDEGILPRNPSSGHLEPESPLSPQDIRDRLVNMTQQSSSHKGGLSSLLTFGLLAPVEKTTPDKDHLVQAVVDSTGSGGVGEDGQERVLGQGEEEATDFHHSEDVETSSVQSNEQLTESFPLLPPFKDGEKTPTQDNLPTPLHLLPSPSAIKTAPLPSKYSKITSVSSPLRMPEHLKPTHKPAASSHFSLPPTFLPNFSHTLHADSSKDLWTTTSLPPRPTQAAGPRPLHSQAEQSNPTTSSLKPDMASSSSKELAEALHSKVHLEGQLESVMEECQVLLKERAELISKLAVLETQLQEAKREGKTEAVSTTKIEDPNSVKLREEVKLLQRELEKERRTLVVVKEESSQGRLSVQQLQAELKEMKKKTETQESLMEELRHSLREASDKLAEEKVAVEEGHHQLHSLQASYKALDDSKIWMQEQLQEALEAKIKLQEELREVKATSISSTVKVDLLARENASFQQQIANLQRGVLQDKAKLVSELEAIEADVLSREDSYTRLVAEKAQLEELAQQRAKEIEKLSTAVGQIQVERDELKAREEERLKRERDLIEQCHSLQKSKSNVERRLQDCEEELAGKEENVTQLQKIKSSLQEWLRQSEAALVSKDGILQGLRDSRDILRQELDMVKVAQQRLEGELEDERRQVARLEASLGAVEDGTCDEERVVKSLTEIHQQLEVESRVLREKLAQRESEVKERDREMADMQTQCQEAVAKFQDLLGQYHSTITERDTLRESIAEKERTIRHLTQENLANRQEVLSFKADRDRLQGRLNTTLQQKSRLEGQLAEQSSLSELEHLQVAVKERTALQKELDTLKLSHQQELLRAHVRQDQLEAGLKTAKRDCERAQSQAEKALQAKEEISSKMTELKSQTEFDLNELRCSMERVLVEKQVAEREAVSLRAEMEEMQEFTRRLQHDAENVRERLVRESAQREEVQRESEVLQLKLKHNAEEREKQLLEQNQSLSLELERLKGRLAGISSTQLAVRSHASELETALAQKESSLTKTSAEVQRLLEERQNTERQVHTQTSLLQEETTSLRAELTETRQQLQTEQKHVEELSESLKQATNELSQVRMGQSAEGRSVPALEEKVARISKVRDDLRLELTTVKAQLVMAKTAAETSERELTEKRTQVEVLQQKLSASDAQCREAERETRELRGELQRVTEVSVHGSTMIEGRERQAEFDTSLSTIEGEEDTDHRGILGMLPVQLCVCQSDNYVVFSSYFRLLWWYLIVWRWSFLPPPHTLQSTRGPVEGDGTTD